METDVQQLVLVTEEAPEEQSAGVDQQDPEHLHIKEEQEELWTSLEEEHLCLKEETDAARFPFTVVSIKSDDDEEKPLFSQLHQQQIEGRDVPSSSSADQMTAETSRNPDLNLHEQTSDSSETEVSGDDEDVTLDSELSDFGPKTGDEDNDWNESRSSESDVPMKSEDDEESPSFLQLQQQMKDQHFPTSSSADQMTAEIGGRAESTKNSDLNPHEQTSDPSETEVIGDDEMDDDVNLDSELSNSRPKTGDENNDGNENMFSESDVMVFNKPFSCTECSKTFFHKGSLQKRVREMSHSAVGSSGCLVDKKCVRVKQHVDSCRKVQKEEKSCSCGDCGKRLGKKSNLNHVRVHTGQKPFPCELCEHRFSQKSGLSRHMTVHTGEKIFVCELCGQRFSRKAHLNIHMIVHTGQKPFTCELCGQRFSHKATLTTHMRVHTGQKPFACQLCGQRFSQKTNLNTHMRVHTGQKPFACELCKQKFRDKSTLNKHIRVHTGQKPFACELCRHRFSCKAHLHRHMIVHTRMKPV